MHFLKNTHGSAFPSQRRPLAHTRSRAATAMPAPRCQEQCIPVSVVTRSLGCWIAGLIWVVRLRKQSMGAVPGWKNTLFFLLMLLVLIGGPSEVDARVDEVMVGLNLPLSGPYQRQGEDQQRAYLLAIEQINARGGVLGHRIVYRIKDTKTNPRVALHNTIELIRDYDAALITGGSSSAVAMAQSDVCQQYGVIYMAALTHSNAITGHLVTPGGYVTQKAHRHTFRWFCNAWMTSKTLVPYLVKEFGKAKQYYYITADYNWGHSLEKSLQWDAELAGCDTIGSVRTPLGKKNFKKELLAAQKAKPDILVLVLFGQDMTIALKQAYALGLKKTMRIVVPLIELNMAAGVGRDALQDVIATTNWYWRLAERYNGSKHFVDSYRGKYAKVPGSAAASAWVAIHEWAAAAAIAGSFESAEIIKALEGREFTLLKDREQWRAWDHQAVSSVYVVKGKSPLESNGLWDILQIVDERKGVEVMRTVEENPVILE